MWRRTLDSWGYSPLDEINRDNVDNLRMVWSRALAPGRQQGTPLVYDGVTARSTTKRARSSGRSISARRSAGSR